MLRRRAKKKRNPPAVNPNKKLSQSERLRLRWARVSPEERRAHALMMNSRQRPEVRATTCATMRAAKAAKAAKGSAMAG
jgi:hypothetical protein